MKISVQFVVNIFTVIITFVYFNNGLFAADFWERQPSPTSRNLKNVFFLNNNTGWISGDSGTMIRTNNGGGNWDFQNTKVFIDIQAMYFINDRLGWAVGWEIVADSSNFLGTRILKTTDGGLNWNSEMYPVPNYFMKTVFFIDSLKGFMAGAPLTLVMTTNAGVSWNSVDTDTSLVLGFPIENLKFINPQVGYAAGGFRDLAGCMWETTNGGYNWTATIVGPEPMIDLYIFNPLKTFAAGGDFEYGSSIVKTFNQGVNWFYDTLGVFGVANSIDFRNQKEGWISVGSSQKFTYTLDTGNTWTSIFTPDSIPIFDIDFSDSLHGWAVGYYGCILKYNSGVVSVSNVPENISSDDFVLYQNYPNPFNPKTIINYDLRNTNYVTLTVYDAVGKEVITLEEGIKYAGKHSVTFDGNNLPSGIYFYKLFSGSPGESGNYYETKRMLLIK